MNKATPWHPVPTRLVDEVMPNLKDTELRVLLVVLRQTWGWRTEYQSGNDGRKRRDWLSHSQLCRRTGRGSEAVSAAVAALVTAGLITVEDAVGRPLASPEERRRYLGRLYFRLGDTFRLGDRLAVNDAMRNETVEKWKTDAAPRPGKPETTTERIEQ